MQQHLIALRVPSLLLLAALPTRFCVAEPSDMENRLREGLRSMAAQVRTMQTERDTALAKQAELEQKNKELEDRLKTLTKHAAEDKEAMESLKAKLAEQERVAAGLTAELEKWKQASADATNLARTREAEKAALADKVILLERQVADQRTKNLEMFKLGKEILARYEKFGLGTAITAREPFVGITRVKLENLVQDYSDKLAAQRIKP